MADSFQDMGSITAKWMRPPNWASSIGEKGVMSRILISHPGTRVQIFEENPEVPLEHKYLFMNKTKQEEYEWLSFFGTQEGRLKKFWIPEWKYRFNLYDWVTSGATELYVENEQHYLFIQSYHRFYMLMTNGDWIVRRISAIEEIDSTKEKLTLVTGTDRVIYPADIVQMGLFMLVRFVNDKIAVKYHSVNVSEFAFEVRELIREYP